MLDLTVNFKILVSLCLLFASPHLFAGRIEAEGRAGGDLHNAREAALADALREAVRIGTGVDVSATTETRDFTLSFDSVLSHAFGHVRDYRVLGSSLGADGIYRVRVSAEVEKGSPQTGQALAVRHLLMLKGAPRIFFRVEPRECLAFLQAGARHLNLPVAQRAEDSDILIEGEVALKPLGRETLHGSGPKHVFAPRGNLRAVRPDTGELVAVQNFSGSDRASSSLPGEQEAAGEALEEALRGDGEMPAILAKTLSAWVVETDLGALKRLEFLEIGRPEFEKILQALSQTEKVSAVWPREFDASGKSTIDVETRLDNAALAQAVAKASDQNQELGRSSGHVLVFDGPRKNGFFR